MFFLLQLVFLYLVRWDYIFGWEYPIDYEPNLCGKTSPRIDFIIGGAGSAGATLASRLSEEPSWTVLLLEKGNDPPISTEIPILWAQALRSPIDYHYVSEPDEHLYKGLENGVSSIPRGKCSGGCSSINVGMYIRGRENDFTHWSQNGCTGWNYPSVLKYFLKSEDFRGRPNSDFDRNLHNIGGLLSVSPYKSPDPVIPVLIDGFNETGIQQVSDLNDVKSLGFGFADSTTRNGLRCSTFKAFLSPAKLRKNLLFARNVSVQKVIFKKTNRGMKAVGVQILARNMTCTIRTRKEVILSLGVIASPQVLLLSGIGPKQQLEAMGIPVIADLPVGQNYCEHPCYVGMVFSDRKTRKSRQVAFESQRLVEDTLKLIGQNTATMGMTEIMTFLDTGNKGYADIQIMSMRISYKTMKETVNGKHKLTNMFGLSEKTSAMFTELNNQSDTIFMIVILLDTKSRGVIELASTDPEDRPRIYPKMIQDSDEVETLLRGVRVVEKLAKTKALQEYGLQLEPLPYEACAEFEMFSDQYYKCAFEQIVTGFYHPGCTVRMGAENDTSTVLNSKLQVKGVRRLRVVDASSMYSMVSANPNAAVIMMAEKAADIIKEAYGKETDYLKGLY